MSVDGSTLFGLISGRQAWLGERMGVLSENIANADTPGYGAQDLAPANFDTLLRHATGAQQLALARTAAAHAEAKGGAGQEFKAAVVDSFETAPSGNAVELPEQMQKMADTELDYQLTTNLYRRYLGMMRTALGLPQS
ncbi:MAG: flagellar basal body protein [Geminicoccaceae bacterium]